MEGVPCEHHGRTHYFVNPDGSSWQRMVSRLELYDPTSKECPASISCLGKGTCCAYEAIVKLFGSWCCGIKDKDL